MNLYTRCLHCGTTFRVTTQQLQASSGQVRCGQCKQVFDAFATLTAQEPQSSTPERDSPSPTQSGPPLPAPPVAKPPVEKSAPAQIPVRPKERPPAAAAARPDPAASLYEWEFKMPVAPRRTGLWVSLSLLLLALLAIQVAYAFRAELMVLVPQSRM